MLFDKSDDHTLTKKYLKKKEQLWLNSETVYKATHVRFESEVEPDLHQSAKKKS